MVPTKVVVIGAGSVSFGLKTLASLIRSERLRGSQLVLVDRNPTVLEQVERVTVEVARQIMQTVPGGVPTYQPIVRYHAFGASSIDLEVILRPRRHQQRALSSKYG